MAAPILPPVPLASLFRQAASNRLLAREAQVVAAQNAASPLGAAVGTVSPLPGAAQPQAPAPFRLLAGTTYSGPSGPPPAGASQTSVGPPLPRTAMQVAPLPLGPVQGPALPAPAPPPPIDWRNRLREIRDEKRRVLTSGRKLAAKGGGTPAEMRSLVEAHRALRGEERFFEEMDSDGDGIPDSREALDSLYQNRA